MWSNLREEIESDFASYADNEGREQVLEALRKGQIWRASQITSSDAVGKKCICGALIQGKAETCEDCTRKIKAQRAKERREAKPEQEDRRHRYGHGRRKGRGGDGGESKEATGPVGSVSRHGDTDHGL